MNIKINHKKTLERLLVYLAVVWPFGQLLEIPFITGTRLYLLDLIVLAIFGLLITNRSSLQEIKKDKLTKPILIFVVIAFLSLIVNLSHLSLNDSLVAFLYLCRWIIYTAIYYGVKILSHPKTFKVLISSLAAFTVIGLAQYLLLPDTRFLFYLGFDDHYYRLIGTLLDPNFTGLALLIFILLLLSKAKYRLFAILPAIGLALTFSRASYLVSIFIFVYLLLRTPKKIYLLILSLIVISLYLAPKPSGEGVNLFRTFSIYSRIEDSQYGLNIFKEKPVLGHGFNTLRSLKAVNTSLPPRSSGGLSNSFIFILATTGILGFIAFLNLLHRIFAVTWKDPYQNAILIAAITHSFFNNSLFYIWILALLWVIISYKKP